MPGGGLSPNKTQTLKSKTAFHVLETAKLTSTETECDKQSSKSRYIVEQYFGINHRKDKAKGGRFPKIKTNKVDCWFRQVANNIAKGLKILNRPSV
jgi:hypothetical protein